MKSWSLYDWALVVVIVIALLCLGMLGNQMHAQCSSAVECQWFNE